MRSDSSVRLVRRVQTASHSPEWDADVRELFDGVGPEPGWRPWQVLGGPGTGKTALLVDLAAARISAGEDPESVLVLTYSKRAATAVRNALTLRIAALAPELGGVPGATRAPLVRTVHSYAFGLLRTHAATHGNPPPRLLTGSEQDIVLRELLRGELQDGAKYWPERLHPALPTGGFAEQLRDLMLRATERGLGPEDLVELGRAQQHPEWVAAGRFAERYEQTMLLRWSVGMETPEASAPALDAAELVGAALDALVLDPELLAAERDRVRHLLVDDAQHLDPQAAQLVRAIGSGPATAVIAADPDQSVFTFRGADARFAADPGAPEDRRVILRENHRSAPAIQEALARITARLPGTGVHRTPPVPLRVVDAPEGEVRVHVLTTPAKEAALIADHLRRAHLTHGVPWSRMAVIVRSIPLSLAPLRRALLAAGVPVRQPPPEVPLARRRGAAWALLTLRAIMASDPSRHPGPRPDAFTADDALDLLAGPLGGADQISLRRLRRGIRRSVLELGHPTRRPEPDADENASAPDDSATVDGGAPRPATDHAEPSGAAPGDDAGADSRTPGAGAAVSGGREDVRVGQATGPDGEREAERFADLDRSSAEILRDLIIGVGDRAVLGKLTEVESAPLRRVLKAVGRGRAARRRGEGLEETLWAVWTASSLERRWVGQSERGGAVGMQADRDLDAVVGLFEAAGAYVDRLPHATVEGFVEYLEQQEIPQDSAPHTDPGEAVTIVSAHGAAGREWDTVAVAGVQEGIWPNLRPRGTLLGVEELVDVIAGVGNAGERLSRAAPLLAEERRLLLVACGRARRSLLVTAVESVTGDQDLTPSRFLAELDADTDHGAPGRIPAPVDPGRALAMHALIAELRGAVCDPEADPNRADRAARQLARLAAAGVRGAHPDEWYGTADLSSEHPLWEIEDGAVGLSPSTVDQLKTCPLRWALERHGGQDGDNVHALKGNLVHTLVQALAGQVDEAQVKAALAKAWKKVDPSSREGENWHSRQELRRTETMVDTFLAWLRNTRDELTALGVEVPIDLTLPARGPDELPVRIKGRVDRVERDALGRFVIVDVKTGKTPISKQAAEDHAQLATYQVAAAEGALGDGEPGGARLVYVAKPSSREGATQRTQPPLDEAGIDRWRGVIHDAAAATRGPSYLAMRNDGCRHCKVSGSCPVQDTGRQVTDE
ncbi:ATP-dependent helicase [Nocardia otitidiscaviarum]|uniref:ATP-dependent helicase n=1 Tax=Nocardia otitidiscaviarum TaxID=1823 RepID=UPI0018942012|nr:ATP-dependent DNA helicase [Nocardia otitidiscaviarum]MBF6238658.1 ATP-dependent helicase [Nocardia otitidiscaviarum]